MEGKKYRELPIDDFFDADAIASLPRCLLYSITFTGGAADSRAYLRNGTDVSGTIKVYMTADEDISRQYHWSKPLLFNNGLFLDETSGTFICTIQYRPLASHDSY